MRIVVDMQGWQSASRNRGIGRYTLSLVKAMVESKDRHEYILLFNGSFDNSFQEFQQIFNLDGILVKFWYPLIPTSYLLSENDDNRIVSEKIYKDFVNSLNPDFLLITSIFEGLGDNTISYLDGSESFKTGVILYDLIPLIYPEKYLSNNVLKGWYENKLDYLKRAKYLFSISESAGSEAIKYLDWDPAFVKNISTAADEKFKVTHYNSEETKAVLNKYAIRDDFLMYTGGWDFRKNLHALIDSYALLPKSLRVKHQLVIVCSIPAADKTALRSHAISKGITDDEFVLTGYVSDEELLMFYNLCHAFVFPSWHEGFGLPVLEAMQCGKPVIVSNVSSLPEVLDYEDAQFDPHNLLEIAEKLKMVLCDDDFRAKIIAHSKKQVKKFSWDISAKKLLDSMEMALSKDYSYPLKKSKIKEVKPKLAFISPLPPEKSGIGYYSAELIPELSKLYDIDLVTNSDAVLQRRKLFDCNCVDIEDFKNNYSKYDRVLYQVGNSSFHAHMYPLVKTHPGVTVLHDFFLSGGVHWATVHDSDGDSFNDKLYESHGYRAVMYNNKQINNEKGMNRYPCNLPVLENSHAVIFHSRYSANLSHKWYRYLDRSKFECIPLLRTPPVSNDKDSARKALNINSDDHVIISLGFTSPSKQSHRIIEAFDEIYAENNSAKLIFVGDNSEESDYGIKIRSMIERSPAKNAISITGWVNDQDYVKWLSAADIGIQLRAISRGETSGTVLDCMNYGLATIANANGSMAELDNEAVVLLPDEFTNDELVNALKLLLTNSVHCEKLIGRARYIIDDQHSPKKCAQMYFNVIEKAYGTTNFTRNILSDSEVFDALSNESIDRFSQAIADTVTSNSGHKLFIDVSAYLEQSLDPMISTLIHQLIIDVPDDLHVEPVHYSKADRRLVLSQSFTSGILPLKGMSLSDDVLDISNKGTYIIFNPGLEQLRETKEHYCRASTANDVKHVFHTGEFSLLIKQIEENDLNSEQSLTELLNPLDVIILDSTESERAELFNYANSTEKKRFSFLTTKEFINTLVSFDSTKQNLF